MSNFDRMMEDVERRALRQEVMGWGGFTIEKTSNAYHPPTCLGCGVVLPEPSVRGRPRQYHSEACRQRAGKARRAKEAQNGNVQ
jgi:hypothetical protein